MLSLLSAGIAGVWHHAWLEITVSHGSQGCVHARQALCPLSHSPKLRYIIKVNTHPSGASDVKGLVLYSTSSNKVINIAFKSGMLYACNSSPKALRLQNGKILGQPSLHNETLSQKLKKIEKKTSTTKPSN